MDKKDSWTQAIVGWLQEQGDVEVEKGISGINGNGKNAVDLYSGIIKKKL